MSIEGIWTGEIYTPYGWESSGVYILDEGTIIGGSNRHYSTGSYKRCGKKYKAKITVTYYGPPRVIFGDKQEAYKVEVKGKIKGDTIDGEIVRPEKPEYTVQYRMTKRMDLPKNQE
jgi:hypothetical protein